MASLPDFERSAISPKAPLPSGLEAIGDDERSGRMTQEMMRYRVLIARTVDAFGDEIKASLWLSLPNHDFGGKTPLQVAQTNGYDLQAIEPVLIRIEHGVDF